MKRITMVLAAAALLAACGGQKSDIQIIEDFYKGILGQAEMSENLLRQTLSDDILASLWEEEYIDTYSFWKFRTGFQDGPSRDSELESIEPMGDGWYRVSYTDMGTPATTCVKMEKGKITDYKPASVPYQVARNYFKRNDVADDSIPSKITSQEELLKYFGMAAVMGPNGQPTPIDFEKQFVIPVVRPVTDIVTELYPQSLIQEKSELTFTYREDLGEKTTFSMQPILLVIVNRSDLHDANLPVRVVRQE